MTAINQDIDNLKSGKYWIDKLEALEQLERSDYYRIVFGDGYFMEQVLDGVKALKGAEREAVREELLAVSYCQSYLQTIKTMGLNAKQDLIEQLNEE